MCKISLLNPLKKAPASQLFHHFKVIKGEHVSLRNGMEKFFLLQFVAAEWTNFQFSFHSITFYELPLKFFPFSHLHACLLSLDTNFLAAQRLDLFLKK